MDNFLVVINSTISDLRLFLSGMPVPIAIAISTCLSVTVVRFLLGRE